MFCIWLVCNTATVGIYIFHSNKKAKESAQYFLIIRSFLSVLITTIKPLYHTHIDNDYTPIPPNKESIQSIDMVLHIPIAAHYFYEYLDSLNEEQDGPMFFSLYADLR